MIPVELRQSPILDLLVFELSVEELAPVIEWLPCPGNQGLLIDKEVDVPLLKDVLFRLDPS